MGNEESGNEKDVLSAENLLRRLKNNVARKLLAGETSHAPEIKQIAELEKQLADQAKQDPPPTPPEYGIPDNFKIKRSYTMSESARVARQLNAQKSTGPQTAEGKAASAQNGLTANWKHGEYSKSVLKKTFGVCTGTDCGKYPCKAVSDKATDKGGLCLDHDGLPGKISIFVNAAKSGNIDEVKELSAVLVALTTEIYENMVMAVGDDGVVLISEQIDKNGKVIGTRLVPHPLIAHIPEYIARLGLTLPDQRMTSREQHKDKEIEDAAKASSTFFLSAGKALAKALKSQDDPDAG